MLAASHINKAYLALARRLGRQASQSIVPLRPNRRLPFSHRFWPMDFPQSAFC
jgi:hypothetical protein